MQRKALFLYIPRITLLPDQIAIPSAFQAFGPDGHLVDPKQEAKGKPLVRRWRSS